MAAGNFSSKIFYSKAGIDVVTQPYLVGKDLEKLAQRCSVDFLKEIADAIQGKKVVVLNILMGGRYYKLHEACQELKIDAQLAEVRAKRSCDDGKWRVKIWFDENNSIPSKAESLKRIQEAEVLLIGDTIGTGTTLSGVLDWVAEQRQTKCDAFIYTIAGGDSSLKKIATLAPKFNNLRVFLANAAFHLAENGTDLGFAYADFHPDAKLEIKKKLGNFSAQMKCAVWDWGDRFTQPSKHLQ